MDIDSIRFYSQNKYFKHPQILQMEVTNVCPLKCKQCYKSVSKKYISIPLYNKIINECNDIGVKTIMLNGGEPLCHPDIDYFCLHAAEYNINTFCFTSGYNLTEKNIDSFNKSNTNVSISLNGSTETINSLSRDGYEYSLNALELLKSVNKIKYGINWVARADNVYDFPNLVELALKKKASWINVISNKIVNSELVSPLGIKEYSYLSKCITTYRRQIDINIETCFSLLLVFMDVNRGETAKGCFAGRGVCFVDADGNYMPCSHLYYPEKRKSLLDYWNDSKTLASLREDRKQNFCNDCSFESKCRFCHAVSKETHDNLCYGYNNCPVKNLINQK